MCFIFYERPKIVIVLYFFLTEGILLSWPFMISLFWHTKNNLLLWISFEQFITLDKNTCIPSV